MNDERYLKDWLQDSTDSTTDPRAAADTTDSTPDPNAAADRIAARIPDIPQRRRWLPWPPARRHQTDDAHMSRRTRSMFSPLQAVTAGALSLAVGGAVLLTTQDSAPTDPVLDAAGGPVEAVPVRVEFDFFEEVRGGVEALPNGADRTMISTWEHIFRDATDPRFEGAVVSTDATDVYGDTELSVYAWRLENEGGAWQTAPMYAVGPTEVFHEAGETLDLVFYGEGGYDGHVAVMLLTYRPDADLSSGIPVEPPGAPDFRLEGHILDTPELPGAPEPWDTAE